jgi:hypothetical protein
MRVMKDRKPPPLDLGDTTRRPTDEQLDAVMKGLAERVKLKNATSRRFRIVAGPEAFPPSVMKRIRKLEDDG